MKEEYLKFEQEWLMPYAARSEETAGRAFPMPVCPMRTEFQRDRDRILHCKAFRRLKHKTQVFLSPGGDHYRTRLTHTLEVTQIARTISRGLRLNEDLTEAIALGHDLGHTPFGHNGERTLNALTGHFFHNEQSLRVVELLENDGRGLNLTQEVRDGILHHRIDGTPATLEGVVVSYADRIAYLNHDIDDAIRAGILNERDLPADIIGVLGNGRGNMIGALVNDIIAASYGKPEVVQSPALGEAMRSLRAFMFRAVYNNPTAKKEDQKAERLLKLMFDYFTANPEEIPALYKIHTADVRVQISDYIAGMTDTFAVRLFREKFVPHSWED